MAGEFGPAVLRQHLAELIAAQQFEGTDAALAAAAAVEAHRRAGRGGIEGLGVEVGKDRFQQALQIALALRQPLAEVAHLPAALLQQGHQGRLVGRLGQHLNQHAATAAHAVAVDLLADEHC